MFVSMSNERRQKSAMIHDRLGDELQAKAAALGMTPNALVNAALEAIFREMDAVKPEVPPLVRLYRRATRQDLSGADKLLIGWLEKHFPGWKEKTEDYRRLTVQIASEIDDLDSKKIEAAADQAWKTVNEQKGNRGGR